MKPLLFVAILVALAGCGGSGTGLPTAFQGSYVGPWSETLGGPPLGSATVSIDATNAVSVTLPYTGGSNPTLTATGQVTAGGHFSGTLVRPAAPTKVPVAGAVTVTPTGITMNFSYTDIPGVPLPQTTFYITATKQ